MTVLFARFVLLLVLSAGIAVAALSQGQLHRVGSDPVVAGSVACTLPCTGAAAEAATVTVESRAGSRRTLRWHNLLPGTFR